MNPFKKQQPKFLSEKELEELKKKVASRKIEFELRQEQKLIEEGFKNNNKMDMEKIKKWLIIGVVGIFLAIIIFKVVGKFI